MADPTPDEKALLQVLHEAESLNAPLQKDAQRIVSMAQDSRDIAGALRTFVGAQPPQSLSPDEVRRLTITWRRQNDATRAMRAELAEMVPHYSTQYALTTNTSSSSAVTAVLTFEAVTKPQPTIQHPFIGAPTSALPPQAPMAPIPSQHSKLVDAIQAVFKRQELFPIVRDAMLNLGLDKEIQDLRSPLSWLEECKTALETPGGDRTSPVAVLIALRSCIERTIAELLRRRPTQESASSWNAKIVSIGKSCGKVSLPSGYFAALGDQAQRNSDNLAKAKERAIARELLVLQYHDGLKFLEALLMGIDKKKLRA